MSERRCQSLGIAAILLVAMLLGETGHAGEIRSGVSSRETYVGKPVTFQIQFINVKDHREPEIPDVDGLEIKSSGAPMRQRVSSSNLRSTTVADMVIYSYEVTPLRAGTFAIPPITVTADGRSEILKAIRIVANASETGDLMFVEISGERESIYVGELLDVTLKIWLRPYQERGMTMTEEGMWRRILLSKTDWGIFTEAMTQLAERRRRPAGQEVLRTDSQGNERSYYLYEINAAVYPERPGKLDSGGVKIVVYYPTGLGQTRRSPIDEMIEDAFKDFPGGSLFDRMGGFGTSLGVTSSRPIIGEASVDPIEVKPVPTEGRPDDFRGAVGQFRIETSASTSSAKVGDPVTLNLDISGNGRMDLLRAPSLADQETLTKDFKVDREELPGFISNQTKSFQTTVRPKHDGVRQIPPVLFSYFDPRSEQFVTTTSEPIDLKVEKAETLALDSIVANRKADDQTQQENEISKLAAGPRLQNFTGDLLLVRKTPAPAVSDLVWLILLLPPIVCGLGIAALRHQRFVGLFSRWVSAKRQFARDLAGADDESDVARAMELFLFRRFGSQSAEPNRSWPIGQIRARGEYDLASRVERFYSTCDKADYIGAGGSGLETIKADARALAEEVAALRSQRIKGVRRSAATAGLLLAWIGSCQVTTLAAAEAKGPLVLSDEQRRVLLQEAEDLYQRALKMDAGEEATECFSSSAQKYQLVVDSGVQNDRLHYNLANAQYQSQQFGRAIANYRRALKYEPNHRVYRQALLATEDRLAAETKSSAVGFGRLLRDVNARLCHYVAPRLMLAIACLCWFVLWGVLLLRVSRFEFPWKSIAAVSLAVSLVSAASYFDPMNRYTRTDQAVLALPEVALRDGDGERFPVTAQLEDAEGTVVQVLDARGAWIRIRLDDARSGWVAESSVEVI